MENKTKTRSTWTQLLASKSERKLIPMIWRSQRNPMFRLRSRHDDASLDTVALTHNTHTLNNQDQVNTFNGWVCVSALARWIGVSAVSTHSFMYNFMFERQTLFAAIAAVPPTDRIACALCRIHIHVHVESNGAVPNTHTQTSCSTFFVFDSVCAMLIDDVCSFIRSSFVRFSHKPFYLMLV